MSFLVYLTWRLLFDEYKEIPWIWVWLQESMKHLFQYADTVTVGFEEGRNYVLFNEGTHTRVHN